MGRRKLLSLEEREKIEKLLKTKRIDEIAIALDRPYPTIQRDVQKNGGKEKYNAVLAHKRCMKSLHQRPCFSSKLKHKNITTETKEKILEMRGGLHSYQQISTELNIPYHTVRIICAQAELEKDPESRAPKFGSIEDRLYAIEQQIEILFSILEEK